MLDSMRQEHLAGVLEPIMLWDMVGHVIGFDATADSQMTRFVAGTCTRQRPTAHGWFCHRRCGDGCMRSTQPMMWRSSAALPRASLSASLCAAWSSRCLSLCAPSLPLLQDVYVAVHLSVPLYCNLCSVIFMVEVYVRPTKPWRDHVRADLDKNRIVV